MGTVCSVGTLIIGVSIVGTHPHSEYAYNGCVYYGFTHFQYFHSEYTQVGCTHYGYSYKGPTHRGYTQFRWEDNYLELSSDSRQRIEYS